MPWREHCSASTTISSRSWQMRCWSMSNSTVRNLRHYYNAPVRFLHEKLLPLQSEGDAFTCHLYGLSRVIHHCKCGGPGNEYQHHGLSCLGSSCNTDEGEWNRFRCEGDDHYQR